MTSGARRMGRVSGRLRLAVAGAVVAAVLAVGTGGTPAPTIAAEAHATELGLLGASFQAPTRPRSVVPVFVLDNGRYTRFDGPGASATKVVDVNNRA